MTSPTVAPSRSPPFYVPSILLCTQRTSFAMVASIRVLPEGAGWAVVCGLGFFFAGIMIILSFIQQRYTDRSIKDTDEFASASRSVKPGLVAAGIVSA